MNKIIYVALFATMNIMCTSVAFANSIKEAKPTSPSEIILSQQSAILRVKENVSVKNGVFSLILPDSVEIDSFVLATKGMDVSVLEVNPFPVASKDFPLVQKRADMLKKIEQVTIKISALDARIKVLSSSQQVFTSSKDINSLDSALGNRFEMLYAQKNTLVQQKIDLTTELQAIDKALIQATGSVQPTYKHITVMLTNATVNGNKDIAYSYMVHNAGWRPVYQVEADMTKNTVHAKFSAEMWQRTAFSWGNVPVVITTANPTYGVEPVYLSRWNINTYKQPQPRTAGFNNVQTMELKAQDAFIVDSVTTAVQWKLGKQNIIAGEQRTVAVSTSTWEADFLYTLRPYFCNQAFLTASLKKSNVGILPGGRATFTVNGTPIGKGYFLYTQKDEDLVYFGSDPMVTGTMQLVKDTLVTSKKDQIKTWKWDIKIQNMRKASINILVQDSKPQTMSPQIALSFEESKPVPTVKADMVEWKIDSLKANKMSTIEYTITATAPLGVEIASPR